MHEPAGVVEILVQNPQNTPYSEIQNTPLPPKKMKIVRESKSEYYRIPPPPNENCQRVQIREFQNTPLPRFQTSEQSCNPGDCMWRLICNPRGYHLFFYCYKFHSLVIFGIEATTKLELQREATTQYINLHKNSQSWHYWHFRIAYSIRMIYKMVVTDINYNSISS